MDRIKWITLDPPEDGYEAYLYHLKIWKALSDKQSKNYIGWHKGRFETDPYVFSSKDKELAADYATGAKVEYHVIQYGTCYNMAYMETVMLNQAEGGIGAAKSPNWYNKTNGGGKYSVGNTGEKQVNFIEDNLKNKQYKRGYSSKKQIQDMLNPTLGGKLKDWQVRFILFDPKFVDIYMDQWDADPNPDNMPDLIFFMPKKGSKDLPIIIGGNQTGRGCVNSKHGVGMNHVEIPYSDWSKLGTSDLSRLGNRLNPRDEKERKRQTEEDAAKWLLDHCEQNKLTRVNSKMETVLDFKHASCVKELLRQGWKKRQLDVIFRVAQTMFLNKQDPDDNVILWDDESLRADKIRHKNFEIKKTMLLKENDGDYDWVYKVSVDVGYHKVLEEIERVGYKTKGLVYFYFKNDPHSEEYLNQVRKNRHGVKFGEVRWKTWKKEFLKGYQIHEEYLPTSKKKAIADGWYEEKS